MFSKDPNFYKSNPNKGKCVPSKSLQGMSPKSLQAMGHIGGDEGDEEEVQENKTSKFKPVLKNINIDLDNMMDEEGIKKYGEEGNAIIKQLRAELSEVQTQCLNLIQSQQDENNTALENGYQEAYEMLEEQKQKNAELESKLYDEYDNKLCDFSNHITKKLDQFLDARIEQLDELGQDELLEKISAWRASMTTKEIFDEATNSDVKEKMKDLTVDNVAMKTEIQRIENENKRLTDQLKKSEELNSKLPEDLIKEAEEWKNRFNQIKEMGNAFIRKNASALSAAKAISEFTGDKEWNRVYPEGYADGDICEKAEMTSKVSNFVRKRISKKSAYAPSYKTLQDYRVDGMEEKEC